MIEILEIFSFHSVLVFCHAGLMPVLMALQRPQNNEVISYALCFAHVMHLNFFLAWVVNTMQNVLLCQLWSLFFPVYCHKINFFLTNRLFNKEFFYVFINWISNLFVCLMGVQNRVNYLNFLDSHKHIAQMCCLANYGCCFFLSIFMIIFPSKIGCQTKILLCCW